MNDIFTNTSTDSSGYFFDDKMTRDKLKANQDRIKQELTALRDAIYQCANSPNSCVYPSGLNRADYVFRKEIPVQNGSVSSWHVLHRAELRLANANKQLVNTSKTILGIPNPAYSRALQDVAQATLAVQQATSTLDSTAERFLLWIDRPSRERCGHQEHEVCRNNAQLDEIRRNM
jgi:hypothetical protein